MLDSAPLVAFAPTTDLDRARDFYGTTLGLRVVEATPYAVVLDAAGTTLRVTLVGTPAAAPYTVLGWDVSDLDTTIHGLVARGVAFVRYDGMEQDGLGAWTAPGGARVAWFRDPDGNTLSLTQHPLSG
jgi:catechol 2,3-dioxygenase-like lactoylglutathione lyase family enzyme